MRRALLVVLVMVLALSLVSATAVGAKPPSMGDRTGEMDLEFNLGFPAEGPGGIAWIGTIEFDHGVYAIAFFFYPGPASKVVSHWTETFKIYEYDALAPCFEMTGPFLTTFACGEPVLVGHDKGITHLKKLTWLGNGSVDEASGPFEEWDGRNTKIKGDFTLNPSFDIFVPYTAEGTLRFN
jgi:hypothetical protein